MSAHEPRLNGWVLIFTFVAALIGGHILWGMVWNYHPDAQSISYGTILCCAFTVLTFPYRKWISFLFLLGGVFLFSTGLKFGQDLPVAGLTALVATIVVFGLIGLAIGIQQRLQRKQ